MAVRVSMILFAFFYFSTSLAGQKINPMIGKREIEVTTFFLWSHYSEFGLTGIYRKPAGKVWKVGGGFKLAYGSLNERKHIQSIYPSVLFDIARYVDYNQQWSIHFQPEYYFYTKQYDPYSGYNPTRGDYTSTGNYKMGFSFSLAVGNRTIISKKLQLILGLFNSYQYVRTIFYYEYQSNPGQPEVFRYNKFNIGAGLRVGLIF